MLGAEQGAEAGEHGLGLKADAFDRIDGIETTAESGQFKNGFDIMPRRVGEDDFPAG